MALVNVKLAVAASFGLCSLVGLPYGPMHTLIICLLIGLGVDNAFVIVQEFNNSEEADQKNVPLGAFNNYVVQIYPILTTYPLKWTFVANLLFVQVTECGLSTNHQPTSSWPRSY
jgi:hypothetical protein